MPSYYFYIKLSFVSRLNIILTGCWQGDQGEHRAHLAVPQTPVRHPPVGRVLLPRRGFLLVLQEPNGRTCKSIFRSIFSKKKIVRKFSHLLWGSEFFLLSSRESRDTASVIFSRQKSQNRKNSFVQWKYCNWTETTFIRLYMI